MAANEILYNIESKGEQRMKEVNVTSTKYECENCGSKYSDEDKIYTCPISGKAICDECATRVFIFDQEKRDMGIVKVHPGCVKRDYSYNLQSDYFNIVGYFEHVKEYEKIKEVTKRYLQNDCNYIKSLASECDKKW